MTLKTMAVYQRNVIKHFLPLECTKLGQGYLQSPGLGSSAPPTPRDSPGNAEKPPGVVGLFVGTKAFVFPGEMLWMLWNLT